MDGSAIIRGCAGGSRSTLRYNQEVRIVWASALILCLAACNRGNTNKEAVRQGVIDFVASRGLNVQGMNVALTTVQFNGNHADATVEFTPKGGAQGSGMSMQYQLEQQGSKWVVTGRRDMGAPHGGNGAAPGQMPADNPHGATGAPAGGGSAMPSPHDLPPVKKK
jgi:hypothetical protein